MANFVELIVLVLKELRGEIRAEGHDKEGDALQGVHQVQHRQEPEIENQITFYLSQKRPKVICDQNLISYSFNFFVDKTVVRLSGGTVVVYLL